MDPSSVKRVNLRGMIQLDQMEDFLSQIVSRMNKQDQILQHLQDVYDKEQFISYSDMMKQNEIYQKELDSLKRRLERVETSSFIPMGPGKM